MTRKTTSGNRQPSTTGDLAKTFLTELEYRAYRSAIDAYFEIFPDQVDTYSCLDSDVADVLGGDL